jgi:hypothetical protein
MASHIQADGRSECLPVYWQNRNLVSQALLVAERRFWKRVFEDAAHKALINILLGDYADRGQSHRQV